LLFGYYTKPFIRQQVNWAVKLPRDIQENLDPQLKTWLGLDADANVLAEEGDISYKYLNKQFPGKVVA
jgi:fumagillin biosynthesis dioxygenase